MKIVPVTSLVVPDSVRVVCMVEFRSSIRQFKFKVFPCLVIICSLDYCCKKYYTNLEK